MQQSIQSPFALFPANASNLATHNIPQYRANNFVSARIAEADTSQWHAGYIYGLIQALMMSGVITAEQAYALKQAYARAACNASSHRASGGAA